MQNEGKLSMIPNKRSISCDKGRKDGNAKKAQKINAKKGSPL